MQANRAFLEDIFIKTCGVIFIMYKNSHPCLQTMSDSHTCISYFTEDASYS